MHLPSELIEDEDTFSLVLGGPLYQLYLRTHLSTPPLGLLPRRIISFLLICWLPLLLLNLGEGHAWGGVLVPFLGDAEVHIRFLVVLPLLIGAEVVVNRRIVAVVRQFLQRHLIDPKDYSRFHKIVTSTTRLRNSVLLEILLLVFCFTIAHWVWREQLALKIASWYEIKSAGETHLTGAGYWYIFLSLPIFRFILFRWYFRLFLWYQFLWRVRGIPLQLNLFHPDRAAGLGFLAASVPAFSPILLAHSTFLAGVIGNRIWHANANLLAFKMDILGSLLFLMLLVLIPLSFFIFQLEQARRKASVEYGLFASNYVDDFRSKWIQHGAQGSEPLLGTPDIQSLADLSNSFNVISDIRLLPFGKETIIRLLALLILPLLPLTLTIVPLKQIVDWLIKLAF
jgi:hypothetical protein